MLYIIIFIILYLVLARTAGRGEAVRCGAVRRYSTILGRGRGSNIIDYVPGTTPGIGARYKYNAKLDYT